MLLGRSIGYSCLSFCNSLSEIRNFQGPSRHWHWGNYCSYFTSYFLGYAERENERFSQATGYLIRAFSLCVQLFHIFTDSGSDSLNQCFSGYPISDFFRIRDLIHRFFVFIVWMTLPWFLVSNTLFLFRMASPTGGGREEILKWRLA